MKYSGKFETPKGEWVFIKVNHQNNDFLINSGSIEVKNEKNKRVAELGFSVYEKRIHLSSIDSFEENQGYASIALRALIQHAISIKVIRIAGSLWQGEDMAGLIAFYQKNLATLHYHQSENPVSFSIDLTEPELINRKIETLYHQEKLKYRDSITRLPNQINELIEKQREAHFLKKISEKLIVQFIKKLVGEK